MNDSVKIYPSIIFGNCLCSFLSLLGCVTIFVTFVKIKILRSLIYRLIFIISIAEILNSISHFLSMESDKNKKFNENSLCYIQSVVITFTDTITMTFLTIISYTIYSIIVKNDHKVLQKRKFFYLAGVILSVLSTTLALFFFFKKSSGKAAFHFSWCWIKSGLESKDEYHVPFIILGSFYLLLMILNSFMIFRVIWFIQNDGASRMGPSFSKIRETTRKIINYLIVGSAWFIFCVLSYFFPIFPEKQVAPEEIWVERVKFILLAFNGMFSSIRGFFIFLVFISSDKVLEIFSRNLEEIAIQVSKPKGTIILPNKNSENITEFSRSSEDFSLNREKANTKTLTEEGELTREPTE